MSLSSPTLGLFLPLNRRRRCPSLSGACRRRLPVSFKVCSIPRLGGASTDLPCGGGWGRNREMSMTIVQPVGQKRLTNVAVVRLKKRGMRFEIACYKNKVLSWRSGVEKDLDEVLQSQTVYSNVSKGILAKSKDLQKAFDSEDQLKICLEILEKGELQVAGKERESQFNSQFRDVATIVMEKTINPDTQRPYTISMIEQLMHEIHFAVDPNKSSKKQALEIIRDLQKHFPIKRAPMRIRLTIPDKQLPSLMEKIVGWNATVVTKDQSGNQISMICELEPGVFRDCDAIIKNLLGKLEILAVSAHVEGDTQVVDQYEDQEELPIIAKESNVVVELDETMQRLAMSKGDEGDQLVKQTKCSTCNAVVGDLKEYREHFKSEWHKHNLKRKTRQLPPLSAEECLNDVDIDNVSSDLKEYSF